jgi:branched-chain amino acid transport system ATP-binding protein
MDEPSEGFAPVLVQHLEEIILGLKREGLSILPVEQHLYSTLAVADRVYVLETGQVGASCQCRRVGAAHRELFTYLGVH